MKKTLPLVDISKLIFAIGVLGIHSLLFENSQTYIWLLLHCIFRLAVPFFFCASGYFLYKSLKKSENINQTTKLYLKRLIIPLVFWLLLNLPVVIINYYKSGDGPIRIIAKLIRGIIFYPWGAMWYLLALMVAVEIIIPFYKKGNIKSAVIIGTVLYLFALLCNTYYFVVEGTSFQRIIDIYLKITTSARNGIFEGLLFVSSGMLIAEMELKNKISYRINNIVFFLLYLLLIVEVLLTKNQVHADDHSLFLVFIPLIPSLFIFLSQFSLEIDTKVFRKYSTGIYFSHRFVLGIINTIMGITNPTYAFFLTTTIVVAGLSILYKIDNKHINVLIK